MRRESVDNAETMLDGFDPETRAWLDVLTDEIFGSSFHKANEAYRKGTRIEVLCGGPIGEEAVKGAVNHIESIERKYTNWLMKKTSDYYAPDNPCPMFVLMIEWRRRSWDITHPMFIFR
jgi:hypothetical protein